MKPTVRKLSPGDRPLLVELLAAIPIFSPEEVECALELVDIYLGNPAQKDYRLLVAADDDRSLAGYACYGPVPLTRGAFDLYWIAVQPARARSGIGTTLLRHVEDEARVEGGRMLLAETSGRADYSSTRAFYEGSGYVEVARIADYYAPGDDLAIFRRLL